MKKTLATLVFLTLPALGLAQSKTNFYTEVEVSKNFLERNGYVTSNYNLTDLGLTLGAAVTNNLALEAFVGHGISDDTESVLFVPFGSSPNAADAQRLPMTVKNKTSIGISTRLFMPLNEKFELFGRLGLLNKKISSQLSDNQQSDNSMHTDNFFGVSYGVGLAYKVQENFSVVLNYKGFHDSIDSGSQKSNSVGLAARWGF